MSRYKFLHEQFDNISDLTPDTYVMLIDNNAKLVSSEIHYYNMFNVEEIENWMIEDLKLEKFFKDGDIIERFTEDVIIIGESTFKDFVKQGSLAVLDIDDYVEIWHNGKAGLGQELHEFLGLTWEEYSVFITSPEKLENYLREN